MLSRASLFVRRLGTRSISGADVAAASTNFGNAVAPVLVLAGGFYALDSKIETKTNHLDAKLDSLGQAINALSVAVARIEGHEHKQ